MNIKLSNYLEFPTYELQMFLYFYSKNNLNK